jgi:hypothetical protein
MQMFDTTNISKKFFKMDMVLELHITYIKHIHDQSWLNFIIYSNLCI